MEECFHNAMPRHDSVPRSSWTRKSVISRRRTKQSAGPSMSNSLSTTPFIFPDAVLVSLLGPNSDRLKCDLRRLLDQQFSTDDRLHERIRVVYFAVLWPRSFTEICVILCPVRGQGIGTIVTPRTTKRGTVEPERHVGLDVPIPLLKAPETSFAHRATWRGVDGHTDLGDLAWEWCWRKR